MSREPDTIYERVFAEVKRRGTNMTDLARKIGEFKRPSQTSSNWRRDGIPPAHHAAIARALGWTLDQLVNPDATPTAKERPPNWGTPVAHHVSPHSRSDVTQINWEDIMRYELPAAFRVTMPDDSMAPFLRPGHTVTFVRGVAARPGDWVLVADATGSAYVRVYRERRPGLWQAAPLNPAYDALDSERDGLQVLAIFSGMEGRQG